LKQPFFRYFLHGTGEKPCVAGEQFPQRLEYTWHTYAAWPPKEAVAHEFYIARGWDAVFSAPGAAKLARFAIFVRTRESGALPATADFTDVSRGDWRDVGSGGPEICGRGGRMC